jgi:hypothetical protein
MLLKVFNKKIGKNVRAKTATKTINQVAEEVTAICYLFLCVTFNFILNFLDLNISSVV